MGISSDPETGSIIGINLDRLGLSGELKFSTLIGLTSLRNLPLSGNSFSGRLVPQLASIPSLNLLDLSDNQFEGGFPSDLHNLQQLRSLDLYGNQIWGDIGHIFTELGNVEFVDLSCNRFHGGLSLSVDNISSISNTLHHLNLSHNLLSGGGFFSDDSIGLFKNLDILDLENNQINSELPSFGSSLPSLKILKLGGNQLFGNVPEELLQSSIPLLQLELRKREVRLL